MFLMASMIKTKKKDKSVGQFCKRKRRMATLSQDCDVNDFPRQMVPHLTFGLDYVVHVVHFSQSVRGVGSIFERFIRYLAWYWYGYHTIHSSAILAGDVMMIKRSIL